MLTARNYAAHICGAVWILSGISGCADAEAGVEGSPPEADLAFAESALDEAEPVIPPTPPTIESLTAFGTGCDDTNTKYFVTENKTALSVLFTNFSVALDSVQSRADKNCTLFVTLKAPEGYTYAVSTYTYSMYTVLPTGTSANLLVTYGSVGNGVVPKLVPYPLAESPAGAIQAPSETLAAKDLNYLECGSTVPLTIQMVISAQNAKNARNRKDVKVSMLQVDGRTNATGAPGVTLSLKYRKCK